MKCLTLLILLGLSTQVFASPERTRRQDLSNDVREYNVVPLEAEHLQRGRVQRNGEKAVYRDVYSCPQSNGYNCPIRVQESNDRSNLRPNP